MESFVAEVCLTFVLVGVCSMLIRVCDVMWLKPRRIRSMLLKQGIGGPKPSFFFGNAQEMQNIQSMVIKAPSHIQPVVCHDWAYSIFPYFHQWTQQYGSIYMYSTGTKQHLYVSQPELIKELNLHTSLDLGKPSYLTKVTEPMLGDGIIKANGPHWAHQRKLIAPHFFLQRVKHMLGIMEECTLATIRAWESRIESNGGVADITIDQDLRSLSADIISKACFGSSYFKGKQIFAKLGALQEAMSKPSLLFGFPNFVRFLPTKSNRQIWRLKQDVETLILRVVKSRREEIQKTGKSEKDDLLQAILESVANSGEIQRSRDTDRFIVDNCKNIYFAGYESTAIVASWSLMLLALHPEWQERVRAEIIEICGDQLHDCLLDLDKLCQLKSLTMVIQESLRLYGPAIILPRETFAEMRLGHLIVPKGTYIWTLISLLHRDFKNWGLDANEFKPERFAGGISKACKYPQAYAPFGIGGRLCVGQNFAMLELKMVISLILSAFSFSLSPKYRHFPVYKMLLMPEYGVRLLMRKVQRKVGKS